MKRRIKENVWGNWLGYEGTRRTQDFGLDDWAAIEWLVGRDITTAVEINQLRQQLGRSGAIENNNND